MKRLIAANFLFLVFLLPFGLRANPIQSSYVCVQEFRPGQTPLEFRIRETQTCAEGESLMKVQAQGEETVILYPSAPPLTQEQNEVLENYKRYHGL